MEALPFSLHEETQQLRDKYEAQLQREQPSPRLQFELACLLSCSPRKKDILEAIELFDELLEVGYNRTDCLFQAALAHLKIGDYSAAKRRVEMLLRLEPRNLSALSLHSLIMDRASHDGVLGSLLLGLAAVTQVVENDKEEAAAWMSRLKGVEAGLLAHHMLHIYRVILHWDARTSFL